MSKETLICEKCGSSWKRQQTRGRKPRLCPQCLHSSQEIPSKKITIIDPALRTPSIKILDTTKKLPEIIYSGQNNWHCSYCKQKMKTYVGLTEQPMHWCRAKRNTFIPLELVRVQEL